MVILPNSKFHSSKSEVNEGEDVIIGQVLSINRPKSGFSDLYLYFWMSSDGSPLIIISLLLLLLFALIVFMTNTILSKLWRHLKENLIRLNSIIHSMPSFSLLIDKNYFITEKKKKRKKEEEPMSNLGYKNSVLFSNCVSVKK